MLEQNVIDYGADPSGSADSTSAIQRAVDSARHGQVVYLPVGVYLTRAPIVLRPYVSLQGARGRVAGADGNLFGSIIKASESWADLRNMPMSGIITALDSSVEGYWNCNGFHIRDLTIDGGDLQAVADGIAIYGGANAYRITNVAAQRCSGNGFAWLGNIDRAGNPDGAHLLGTLAQDNSAAGYCNTPQDSTFIDCHAQGNRGDGFVIAGNNSWFIGCRADTSLEGNGFTYKATYGSGSPQQVTLSACGTESNFGHGFAQGRATPRTPRGMAPVILSGCNFQGDGRQGSSGGGADPGGAGCAGIYVSGESIVVINGCMVSVANKLARPGCPEYGLRIDDRYGVPKSVIVDASWLSGAASPIRNASMSTAVSIGPAVHTTSGGGIPVVGTSGIANPNVAGLALTDQSAPPSPLPTGPVLYSRSGHVRLLTRTGTDVALSVNGGMELFAAPAGATGETIPRALATNEAPVQAAGALELFAITLPAGVQVNKITFVTGVRAAAGVAHGWYILCDEKLIVRAVSADQTDAAHWDRASTPVTLAMSGATFETPYTGLYYVGLCIVAEAVPSFVAGPGIDPGIALIPPAVGGCSGSRPTSPPEIGAQVGALMAIDAVHPYYAWTS